MLCHLTQLRVLECRIGTSLPSACFEATLPELKLLREIDATATNLNDATLAKMSHLDTLLLQMCSGVTDAGCMAISEQSPNLTRLNLLDCVAITSSGVRALSLLPNLCELGLKSIPCSSDVLFWTLAQLPNLRIVNLDKCEVTYQAVAEHAGALAPWSILNIRESPSLSNATLKHLCSFQTRLTILSVGGSTGLSDHGIASACTLPNLRILDISHLPLVTMMGLNTLRWAPCVWKVDLNGYAESIGDKAAYHDLVEYLHSRHVRVLPHHQTK